MVHPTALPDLFSGDQITVFGRYDGSGDSVIRLIGDVNGKKREFVYEGTFPAEQADNTFIPRLWATRRVGFLLDEIRLRGENAELKDEVIRLSKEFGIMTPYTSYLVLEDDKAYAQHGIGRAGKMGAGGAGGGSEVPAISPLADKKPAERESGFLEVRRKRDVASSVVPMFEADRASEMSLDMPAAPGGAESAERVKTRVFKGMDVGDSALMKEESGSRAVAMSKAIQEYKRQDNAADDIAAVKHVGKKVFTLLDGRWVDSAFKKEMKVTTVKFGSDEYFKILGDKPALKDFLALGIKVTVVLEDGTALVVE